MHLRPSIVQSTVVLLALVALLSVALATSASAEEIDDGTGEEYPSEEDAWIAGFPGGTAVVSVGDASATRVRKAFLTAKKAFHQARQEIQAIKKGEEGPVEDLPSFFDDEEDEGD